MNNKASSLVIGIVIIVAVIICGVVALAYLGYLPLSWSANGDDSDMEQPIGSDYCGYAVGDIIGMYENLMGKNLNNDIGYSVVNALNMEACGTNSKLPSEILNVYRTEYANGWYLLAEDTQARSGYYYTTVVWGNAPMLSNSTLIIGVISGSGVTVQQWYGYNTITITGQGTRSGYLAFALWLTS